MRTSHGPLAVFKIASVKSPTAVLTCTVGDLLVKQSQDHPVHILRPRVPTMREAIPARDLNR